jgi:hypothetical protein
MLLLNVIVVGEKYTLPDKEQEKKIPILYIIRKGINHIFKPVLEKHPGHFISVTWDEDLKELKYNSDTLSQEAITEMLNSAHGKLF